MDNDESKLSGSVNQPSSVRCNELKKPPALMSKLVLLRKVNHSNSGLNSYVFVGLSFPPCWVMHGRLTYLPGLAEITFWLSLRCFAEILCVVCWSGGLTMGRPGCWAKLPCFWQTFAAVAAQKWWSWGELGLPWRIWLWLSLAEHFGGVRWLRFPSRDCGSEVRYLCTC